MTWKYAVGTPSSFEQALDDVVRKLDEMEPKEAVSEEPKSVEGNSRVPRETPTSRDGVPGQNVEDSQFSMQKMATKAAGLLESVTQGIHSQLHKTPAKAALSPDSKLKRTKAVRRLRRPEDRGQSPKPEVDRTQSKSDGREKKKAETKAAHVVKKPLTPVVAASSSQETRRRPTKDHPKAPPLGAAERKIADHLRDNDIDDRDVLRGLKLAVSAACDETLDSWIREKTGLRLRRFLADLKTFEDLEREEVDGGKSGRGVTKTNEPRTEKDGAEEEEEEKAGLGDNEADSDDRRPGRRRAEKGRLDKDRGFTRQQEQVIKE